MSWGTIMEDHIKAEAMTTVMIMEYMTIGAVKMVIFLAMVMVGITTAKANMMTKTKMTIHC